MKIRIDKQFCGPTFSGHGGYTCGKLAHYIKGAAEVTLMKPIPLERDLLIKENPDNSLELLDGETLIASAVTTQFQLDLPAPPPYAEAVRVSENYIGFHKEYLYPECFGCGRNRRPHEGLRIFPGRLNENDLVAAPWIPGKEFQDSSGKIKSEFLWAALDCPGGIACMGNQIQPLLLGKFAAVINNHPRAKQRCIVMGWKIAQEGRKYFAGSALYSDQGDALAYGRAVWIQPRSQ